METKMVEAIASFWLQPWLKVFKVKCPVMTQQSLTWGYKWEFMGTIFSFYL